MAFTDLLPTRGLPKVNCCSLEGKEHHTPAACLCSPTWLCLLCADFIIPLVPGWMTKAEAWDSPTPAALGLQSWGRSEPSGIKSRAGHCSGAGNQDHMKPVSPALEVTIPGLDGCSPTPRTPGFPPYPQSSHLPTCLPAKGVGRCLS